MALMIEWLYFFPDHVPYNKRSYEVEECRARLEIYGYDGSKTVNPEGWLQLTASTFNKDKRGTFRENTISLTMTKKEALDMARHIFAVLDTD